MRGYVTLWFLRQGLLEWLPAYCFGASLHLLRRRRSTSFTSEVEVQVLLRGHGRCCNGLTRRPIQARPLIKILSLKKNLANMLLWLTNYKENLMRLPKSFSVGSRV